MNDKEKIRIKSDALDVDLMLHFRFTAEALEANQDGRLSQEQTSQLIRQALNWLVFAVGVVGLVTPTCMVITLGTADNWLTGITLILGLSTAVFSVIRFWNYESDLRDNRAEAIQGRVRLAAGWWRYRLIINDRTFGVNEGAFLAFKNGDPYCIYYLRHSKKILSAEWLREA